MLRISDVQSDRHLTLLRWQWNSEANWLEDAHALEVLLKEDLLNEVAIAFILQIFLEEHVKSVSILQPVGLVVPVLELVQQL